MPMMELPQEISGGDSLCTNSVISLSAESPDNEVGSLDSRGVHVTLRRCSFSQSN
ncbi:hypothetical protein ES703_43936 [subsurface metagenome]